MRRGSVIARVVTFVVVVALVVAAAAAAPLVLGPESAGIGQGEVRTVDDDSAIPPEFEPSALSPDAIPARGSISVPKALRVNKSVTKKTILIDDAHGNRFSPEDIQPFMKAVTRAGHEVTFVSGDFNESVEGADALVVIDPNSEYSPQEAAKVKSFVDGGGRVVIFGEPNRKALSLFGVRTRRSRLVTLGSEFGMTFGTEYLYDMKTNDGNFQNVIARPADNDVAPENVERATMYTATAIEFRLGKPVLQTPRTTRRANAAPDTRYAVAALHRNGNLLAIGDTSFLVGSNYNVADNEKVLTYIIEFLLEGEKAEETPAGNLSNVSNITGEEGANATAPPADGAIETADGGEQFGALAGDRTVVGDAVPADRRHPVRAGDGEHGLAR